MRSAQRRKLARWGGALLLAVAPLPWLGVGGASATPPDSSGEHQITICHRTNAVSNPYVVITVDYAAADGLAGNSGNQPDHFGEHTGPVFDPTIDYQPPMSGDEWGDIIPPIEGVHDGLNWNDAGIAIWENDCQVPLPEPSETVTTTEPEPSNTETTTEPEPSETVTTTEPEPSNTETTTEPEPSNTETTTEPEPSETVTTTEPEPSETGTTSQPAPGDTSVAPTRSERPGGLPVTGSGLPIGSALAASALLIGLGVLLLAGPGRIVVDRYQRRH